MEVLTVLSLNAHGLGNYKKRQDILTHFWYPVTGKAPHVLFLQETHSSKGCEKFWGTTLQSRNVFYSHDTIRAGGLLMVI